MEDSNCKLSSLLNNTDLLELFWKADHHGVGENAITYPAQR